MANAQGQTSTLDINGWLEKHVLGQANRYAFFEVMRSLRQSGLSDSALREKVRVRPNLSLAFPDTDLASMVVDEDGIYHIEANFFGLYGVASPLPTFYTEDLIQESMQGDSAMRDFIDIFHTVLYPLLYQAWEKYKLWLSVTEHENSLRLQQLYALIGLRDRKEWQSEAAYLLPFAGNLSVSPRSALGLEALLQGVLEHKQLRVMTCVEQTVQMPIEARTYLGQQAYQLGEDSMLGEQVKDCTGKIEIEMWGFSSARFTVFLLGSERYQQMQRLLRWYSPKALSCDLLLWLEPNQREPLQVGQSWCQLGLNTWLGTEHPLGLAPQPVRFLLSTGEQDYVAH
ncbi:type VI secretion system baseplate subunit TssG [Paenalcaligenes faecalis]|uniref:type VI secretion system baseplate subunit TssG n=1 Tax=Paenalcaligenes faecalis TaxID=2980099 RepID=UPI0022B99105|nr:type VI secretion system baseplate subunit TssG [Paenalcaligenes faecalis]